MTKISTIRNNQTKEVRKHETVRQWLGDGGSVTEFAKLWMNHGHSLHVTKDYLHMTFLANNKVDSDDSEIYKKALKDFLTVFEDCEADLNNSEEDNEEDKEDEK